MSTISSLSVGCVFVVLLNTWVETAANNGELSADTSLVSNERHPRHLLSKLCFKLGVCGGQEHGGYQGHGGFQGGHQGGYPAINIGISQSQSSASAGGERYISGSYPNNYQYNGYPGEDINGHPGGYNRPGYFGNGFGSYNTQFNGNYYGVRPQGGGYGFQAPHGNFYDDGNSDVKPIYENNEDYFRSAKSKH